uniref:non-specific serine/threonine protein kinase n=1 Tax=Cacopsylla melanoneura TaxID=428564 RepID=A0A8D8XJS4_9HEMI
MAYRGLSRHVNIDSLRDPRNKFKLQELIGEGTYGEVYWAKDVETGDHVAIKIMENIPENIEEIEEEYLVLKDLSVHPNIPSFYGLYLRRGGQPEEDQLWFVMELCTGGSVTDLVQGMKKRGVCLSEDQIAYILNGTVQSLTHLHRNHCMHRDIKGHNILLTEEADVKLVDFGVSSHLCATLGRRNTSVGTPYWMAPEVIACEQQLDMSYDARCDIWSLGITAIELAEGDPPLSDLHPMRALFQIPRNPPPQLTKRFDCVLLCDFVNDCLRKDLEERPFARELLRHPLLKKGAQLAHQVRKELQAEIRLQRQNGRSFRQADVTTKHGKLKSERKAKPIKMYVDDLAALDILTEDKIIEQLQKRYEMQHIYTYIGDILLALNPFTPLGLYSQAEQKRYSGCIKSANPPHIYAIADSTYQALLHQNVSQSIIISGESGAGKTESGNLLLKQLVYLGKSLCTNGNLENRILLMNPLMEAFGNAQTGINGNSSRFGKFLELSMTKSGKVTGAKVSIYLLEQSRIVQQAENERNFHVFYYLYDGLEFSHRLEEFKLSDTLRKQHRFLTGDKQDLITKQHNINKFNELRSAFELVGFKLQEVNSIYRILAAILHLGDIQFGELITDDNTDNRSHIIDLAPLIRVSSLLDIDITETIDCLTANSVVTRGEIITRHNSMNEAAATRDALAKALYTRLCDYLVHGINTLLGSAHTMDNNLVIALLDIFGFENFPHNSFEQLCINIANEQLQYYFNQHVFTWEQQEYMAEGIPVDLIEYTDNRPVLDLLLSRPMGLLALLDEESRFTRSTDRTLIEKFHANLRNKLYVRPKSNALCFGIQHFAGRVIYQVEGMLEKNRHFLAPEIIQLLRGSKLDTVRFLFQCPITKTGNLYSASPTGSGPDSPDSTKDKLSDSSTVGLASQSRSQQTAATYFRYSLMELLQRIVSGTPQFVRCIKPNELGIPNSFDRCKVIKQLRCTGVLETIRIRQNGFSHRILFADFLKRYFFLVFNFNERVAITRENCKILLTRLNMDGYAIGKNKVFLKYYHVEYLTKLYEDTMRKIILVQSCVRRWLAKSKYKRIRWEIASSVVTLQRYVRRWLQKQNQRNKMATLDQRKNNMAAEKENIRSPIHHEQSNVNKLIENFSALAHVQAATIIQRHYRGYTVRRKWNQYNGATNNKHPAKPTKDSNRTHHKSHIPKLSNKHHQHNNKPQVNNKQTVNKTVAHNNNNVNKPVKNLKQQADLITFSQKVHECNQDAQKYLRKNKAGVRLSEVQQSPKRMLVEKNIMQEIAMKHHHVPYREEYNSDVDGISWDFPLIRLENYLHNQKSSTNSTEFLGPYNFRQLLRPTQHPPTESLRRIARPSSVS